MSETSATGCSARVWDGFRQYRCPNGGKVERNGARYCGIHDPEKAKKRAEERRTKYEAAQRDREEMREKRFASEFLSEVKRRAGATREEMLDAIHYATSSISSEQDCRRYLRRILGQTP